jgi:hypothetical protein
MGKTARREYSVEVRSLVAVVKAQIEVHQMKELRRRHLKEKEDQLLASALLDEAIEIEASLVDDATFETRRVQTLARDEEIRPRKRGKRYYTGKFALFLS